MTDSVRTPPEELVNPASGLPPLRDGLRGVEQPACLNLSPVTWDYPWNAASFLASGRPSLLAMRLPDATGLTS
jgi:hypothetical protein